MKFRWEYFRAFRDTGWIEIKPITVFIGTNGTGKTAAIQPLLLLRQTLDSKDIHIPLLTVGELANSGSFVDIIHKRQNTKYFKFSIDFDDIENVPTNDKKSQGIGQLPPSLISLQYSVNNFLIPQLKELAIFDSLKRLMLSRHRMENGKYSINFFEEFPTKSRMDKELHDIILNQMPRRFLFDDISMPILREIDNERKSKDNSRSGVNKSVFIYSSILAYTYARMGELLRSIKYIGPLRECPKRLYEYRIEQSNYIGPRGEYTFSLLNQLESNKKFKKELIHWLKMFNLARDITCKRLIKHPELLEIQLKPIGDEFFINYADTCFGVSQLLPLLVQSVVAGNTEVVDIIISEQPEIHLNPNLEITLADFFVSMVKEKKINYIVETHSEHLLMRLRTLIKRGAIKAEDVAVYFTERSPECRQIKKIQINSNGEIASEEWPKGFFEEALTEALRFATMKRIVNE
jgi:predicted ATPase